VGKGIQSTSQKLHQLTQLAKRTSMFDDPAQEINELTMVLKQDIQGLNIQIADLQNMHGAALDGNKQSANHTHTVVDNLRLRLKDTTKEFQEALTIRNDNLKSQTGEIFFLLSLVPGQVSFVYASCLTVVLPFIPVQV